MFGVWAYIVIVSFEPNLNFDPILFIPAWLIKYIAFAFMGIAFFVYIRLKKKVDAPKTSGPLLGKLAIWFFFCFIISIGLLIFLILFYHTFSKASLLFIFLVTITLLYTYVFFRLIRSKLSRTIGELDRKGRHFFKRFIQLLKFSRIGELPPDVRILCSHIIFHHCLFNSFCMAAMVSIKWHPHPTSLPLLLFICYRYTDEVFLCNQQDCKAETEQGNTIRAYPTIKVIQMDIVG